MSSQVTRRAVKSGVSALWDRASSAQHVALHIRSRIFEGRLRSGDRVPQDEIAEALGCSRLPVREAIIALEHEGLVTIEPHRGAFVNPITPNTFLDQYELFGATLGIALRLAFDRSGPTFVDTLAAVQARMLSAIDADEFDSANDDFQSLVITQANSPRLRAVLRVLSGIVPGNFFEVVPGSREIQSAGTSAIVAELQRGHGDQAAASALDMMRSLAKAVVELLTQNGLFEVQARSPLS